MAHNSLIKYISAYSGISLTYAEQELIKKFFIPKKLRRRQYFLQEGDVCKYFGFIVKGAMRQYSVDEKGTEHIIVLGIESWWMGDRESFIMLTPSRYHIDAWEDCELLTITHADSIYLQDEVPAMRKMVKAMDDMNSIANHKRLNSAMSTTAEARYLGFVNEHPDLLQRFPLHVIAAYLGITKETLSRIRSQSVH